MIFRRPRTRERPRDRRTGYYVASRDWPARNEPLHADEDYRSAIADELRRLGERP